MYDSIAEAAACKASTKTAEIPEGLLTCLCTSRQGLSNYVVDSDQKGPDLPAWPSYSHVDGEAFDTL